MQNENVLLSDGPVMTCLFLSLTVTLGCQEWFLWHCRSDPRTTPANSTRNAPPHVIILSAIVLWLHSVPEVMINFLRCCKDRKHHEEKREGEAQREIRDGWIEREERGRVVTRARHTGREGMFGRRWPNDSWQVSSARRPLGSPRKIMGSGRRGGRPNETEQNKKKKKGECDRKRKMRRLPEWGRNCEVGVDTSTGHALQFQGQWRGTAAERDWQQVAATWNS